ncbi:MAG TPA: carbohydrate kinase family protein [Candidatus Limnocylindrales bacterium]|nr:carbohydrate kinase family protein [Candidatus Limnocylindrales bacterium]
MRVTVLGGAAWNRMIHVDRLPDGRGATIHSLWHHDAIGGAGAGKAMNLARLGAEVTLFAGIGEDDAGRRIRDGLRRAGVDVRATLDATGTAQHVNLMDPAGGRVSIMLANGSPDLAFDEDALAGSMTGADVVVVDLAPWTPRALAIASASGQPVWTDLHDHEGTSTWHAPFIEAAEVVFVSHDRLPEPRGFLMSLVERGKRFAVCTMGPDGAVAVDADRRWYDVPALPGVTVVDSNGAGDAFFAGTLFGILEGVSLETALVYGSRAAALSVTSTELASEELTPERARSEVI